MSARYAVESMQEKAEGTDVWVSNVHATHHLLGVLAHRLPSLTHADVLVRYLPLALPARLNRLESSAVCLG